MCCKNYTFIVEVAVCQPFIMPPPRGGGALSGDRRPSSVCLVSRTSALTRKPKGLGRRNFAQGYPRSHATPTPTSRSKGQKSGWGGGILWRPPSRTACVSRIRVMNHNWSARKQCLHLQSAVGISRHSALSEDTIRQCGTSSESRRTDTDQCLKVAISFCSAPVPCENIK